MVDAKLISRLRCPIDGNTLQLADETLVKRVNEAIGEGQLRGRSEQKISDPIEAGLIDLQAVRMYPVRGGIPSVVVDEVIELDQLA